MDRVGFIQTEGFPWDVNILDFAQKATQISQQLGEIIAPLAIVKGCNENGNNVSDGLVYINGELLPFKGALKQDKIRIVEQAEQRELENGVKFNCLITRYATFGAGAGTTYNYADFHRSISNKDISKRLVHVGFIQDFYGDLEKIPAGWFLCDGTNGTPDLRGLFVVGYDNRIEDYDTIGKIGGAKEVTLTTEQMPKHKHSGSVDSAGAHSHYLVVNEDSGWNDYPTSSTHISKKSRSSDNSENYRLTKPTNSSLSPSLGKSSESGSHTHNLTLDDTGENKAHENRPPFYVLAKIMYKG